MTKILGISGKKQSGKTTAGNFLFGCAMLSAEIVEYATIDDNGNLVVPYESGNGTTSPCVFPVDSFHPSMVAFMSANIWSDIKIYNFADNLKQICINILGLTERQCYGTDEEKNSKTNFAYSDVFEGHFDAKREANGHMTAREIMQYVGTNFFRHMYPNVWVDSTIRRVNNENPRLAVVVDCRFPNEVEGIQSAGGKVIRLTRNVSGDEDRHDSETALDGYEGFDAVIDNQNMSIGEQNESLYNQVADWGFIDYKAVARSAAAS